MSKNQISTRPLKAVYCYYFPEVRQIIDKVAAKYPHDIFLQSIVPGLDNFHEPVIQAYIDHFGFELPALASFPHRYVAGGASESIFHILSYIKSHESNTPLYVLEGEYEGYAGYGRNLGLEFHAIKSLDELTTLPKGILFLSNPSARDGNIIDNQEIIKVADSGHRIIYDATYVGLTDKHLFKTDHPNIIAVIVSLSKPFGLYYYRIGFAFTRFELPTLLVNKWFKNIHSLVIAHKVLTEIDSQKLVDTYRKSQKNAIDRMSRQFNLSTLPSDVVLLSHTLTPPKQSDFEIFNRQSNYRYCLTPYFLADEREGDE